MTKVTGTVQDYFGPTYETDSEKGPVTEYAVAPPAPPSNGIPSA